MKFCLVVCQSLASKVLRDLWKKQQNFYTCRQNLYKSIFTYSWNVSMERKSQAIGVFSLSAKNRPRPSCHVKAIEFSLMYFYDSFNSIKWYLPYEKFPVRLSVFGRWKTVWPCNDIRSNFTLASTIAFSSAFKTSSS